jgi:pSer/pThr/pTyr-binding forkhead associated (FHA) protein
VTVSRRHAVLVHRDDGYYIDDEESLNGTYVNAAESRAPSSKTGTRCRSASTD